MDVAGCHIDVFLSAESEDGFSAIVTRVVEGQIIQRGPFLGIRAAQVYAHQWTDPVTPPPINQTIPEESLQHDLPAQHDAESAQPSTTSETK